MLSTKCFDSEENRSRWLYPRGKGKCPIMEHYDGVFRAGNIVFSLQIPFPKEGIKDLDYSRWQQNLIGILQFEILYEKGNPVSKLFHFDTTFWKHRLPKYFIKIISNY